jgi:RNA polymerase sigma-70 factor (ECF subfamily)
MDVFDNHLRGPLEETQQNEQAETIRRAVHSLPEQIRQVVVLIYFQGLKYREAAQVLGIPVGTVKSRLHGAIQTLSETLADHELN